MTKTESCMFSKSVLMNTKLGIFTHIYRSFSGMTSVKIVQEWLLGFVRIKSKDHRIMGHTIG